MRSQRDDACRITVTMPRYRVAVDVQSSTDSQPFMFMRPAVYLQPSKERVCEMR